MPTIRPLVAGALLCAAVGCTTTRTSSRSLPPEPPETEDDERARADFQQAVAGYARARRSGGLDERECKTVPEQFLEVGLEHASATETAVFNAATIYEECGQHERAVEVYEQLLASRPRASKAHNNLGVLLWSRGERPAALDHFKQAVDLDPLGPEPRNNLATALRPRYVRTADDSTFLEAEAALQGGLALDSEDILAYENLARLYYDRGRLRDPSYLMLADLVITQGERVLAETKGHSAELFNLRGLLFVEREDPIHAMRAFRRAVATNPNHVEAHLNGAMIAIRFRDFATAEESLTRAVKNRRYRKSAEAFLGLGVARRGLRDYRGAADAFERAHALDDDDPRALYNLGILYSEHIAASKDDFDEASYEKAIDYFDRFTRRAKQRKSFAGRVADARFRTKQIEELIRITKIMKDLEKKAAAEEAARKRAEVAERKRLLEMERRAMEAES